MSPTNSKTIKKIVNRLDAIIDSSYDGLWVCDSAGKVVRINKASERINNIKTDQVINHNMKDLIKAGLIDRSVTLEVINTKTAVTLIQKLKNGHQILVTGNPVFDDKGELDLVVVNERDITYLNQLRKKLMESRALTKKYRSELLSGSDQKTIFSDSVFCSEPMHEVLNVCMGAAQVDATISLRGESGVGKGFLAKLIHRLSHVKDGPFIRIDCGSIPETLIESELFGYERGAFTGARRGGKPGLFELANGGTLFLDEIADLSLMVQAKLLRVLEERKIISLGGTTTKKLNARVIVATNRDLEEMVRRQEFRNDLFFRLNVLPIQIPPLKERGEEIPVFVQFFLEKFNRRYSKNKSILDEALECICQYHFPGNIREMGNLIEQLVVLTKGDSIRLEDLPERIYFADSQMSSIPERSDSNLRKGVERVEKEMIIRALKKCGSQRKAARLLGINQSTLARKSKRYGIRGDAILHQ